MLQRSFVLIILALPLAFGQKREIVELQRDVATLQDQVRTLQRSFDEKMGQVTTLVQSSVDSANNVGKAVAVLEARVNDRQQALAKEVSVPVASVGAKVDQMSTEFQGVRESMTDLLSRMSKLEQKIVDLNNAVRTIQAPALPPPGTSSSTTPSGAPPMAADILYDHAYRDKMGGKPDLALQGFRSYLQYYAETDRAPAAQFWIGQIYYDQADYDNALKNFDVVLEKYPENEKTADAMYMKGQIFFKQNKRNLAAEEFRNVYGQFPKSEAGVKACATLKGLGLTCSAPAIKRRK